MSATLKAMKVVEASARLQKTRCLHSDNPTKQNAEIVSKASKELDDCLTEFFVCVEPKP